VAVVSRHATAGAYPAALPIREVALRLFREHALAVELVSLQLLFALVGALYLGRQRTPSPGLRPPSPSGRGTGGEES